MKVKVERLRKTGALSKETVEQLPTYPTLERFGRGPVVVVECAEEIPCNPCEQACRQNAIIVGRPISNLPSVDADLCSGCGLCIASCPGLAIFVVDMTYGDEQALIQLPYEYFPLPRAGDIVAARDREGRDVGQAQVVKVLKPLSYDRTAVVSITVPRYLGNVVRMISLLPGEVP